MEDWAVLGQSAPQFQVTLGHIAGGSQATLLTQPPPVGFINLEVAGTGSARGRGLCCLGAPPLAPPRVSALAALEPVHQVTANLARTWPPRPAPAPSP